MFDIIRKLIRDKNILVSDHGYDEMTYDDILFRDVIDGVTEGIVIEEYPDYHKGPCILVLQNDCSGRPIHVVWGVPKNQRFPAVLVTAYRPDSDRWSNDFLRRKI